MPVDEVVITIDEDVDFTLEDDEPVALEIRDCRHCWFEQSQADWSCGVFFIPDSPVKTLKERFE